MDQFRIKIPINEVLDSSEGYLIRPFVMLNGQRHGYQWSKGEKGNFRMFLNTRAKHFPTEITGRSNNYSYENTIASAYYKEKCRIDMFEYADTTAAYLLHRYFPTIPNGLPGTTTRFGAYKGVVVNVGLDAHETMMHSKFTNVSNSNKHSLLINMESGGFISHPCGDGRKYYLKFEIRKFDSGVQLFAQDTQKVGKYLVRQGFRTWLKVPTADLEHILVGKMRDIKGEYFISESRFYVPEWLKDNPFADQHQMLPLDTKLVYNVDNIPATPHLPLASLPIVSKNIAATAAATRSDNKENSCLLSIYHTDNEHRVFCSNENRKYAAKNNSASVGEPHGFFSSRSLASKSSYGNQENVSKPVVEKFTPISNQIARIEMTFDKASSSANRNSFPMELTNATNLESVEMDESIVILDNLSTSSEIIGNRVLANPASHRVTGTIPRVALSSHSIAPNKNFASPATKSSCNIYDCLLSFYHTENEHHILCSNESRNKTEKTNAVSVESPHRMFSTSTRATESPHETQMNIRKKVVEKSILTPNQIARTEIAFDKASFSANRNNLPLGLPNTSNFSSPKIVKSPITPHVSSTPLAIIRNPQLIIESNISLGAHLMNLSIHDNANQEAHADLDLMIPGEPRGIEYETNANFQTHFSNSDVSNTYCPDINTYNRYYIPSSTMIGKQIGYVAFGDTFELPLSFIETQSVSEDALPKAPHENIAQSSDIDKLFKAIECIEEMYTSNFSRDILNSETHAGSDNVSGSHSASLASSSDHSTESFITVNDIQIIKNYLDRMIKYDEYKKGMAKKESELVKLFVNAAHKSVAERLNLNEKGETGNPRFVQIMKRFSLSSVHISEEAKDARNLYHQEAKKWGDQRIMNMPIASPDIQNAFTSICDLHFQVAKFAKKDFIPFATASEFQETELFKAIMDKIEEDKKQN